MIETFIRIEGYKNYEVSNFGEIMCTDTGLILPVLYDERGYGITLICDTYGIPTAHRLHRLVAKAFIANPENKLLVNHINEDPGDNDMRNLRWVTRKETCVNKRIAKNNTSSVKGVCWDKRKNKWHAYITVNYKKTRIGYFNNIEDARQARIQRANEVFGIYTNSCDRE
jgi:hypothetical protein